MKYSLESKSTSPALLRKVKLVIKFFLVVIFFFYCAKDLSVSDAKILKTHWCVYEGKVNFTYVNEKRSSVLMCTTLGLLQRGLKYIDTSEAEEMPVSRESKQTDSR